MPFAFHYAARSDVGMVRSNNEDSGYAGPHLLAMADGMGGHAGGDVASSTVIAALVELDDEALGGRDVSQALLDRILAANADIGEQVRADPKPRRHGHHPHRAAARPRQDRPRAHRRLPGVHGARRRRHPDHQGPLVRAEPRRRGPDHAPTRRRPTRSAPSSPGCSPVRTTTSPTSSCARAGSATATSSPPTASPTTSPATPSRRSSRRTDDPGECADRLVALALRAGAPDNVTVVVGDLVDINRTTAPPTQPQVVGAAAVRADGAPAPSPRRPPRRPPRSPRPPPVGTTEPTTASPSPRRGPARARGTVLRVAALLVVAAVVARRGVVRRVRVVPAAVLPRRARTASSPSSAGSTRPSGPVALSSARATRRRSPSTTSRPRTRTASSAASRSTTGRPPTPGSATCALQAAGVPLGPAHGEACRTVPSTWTTADPDAHARPPRRPRPDAGVDPRPRGRPRPYRPSATSSPVTS